MANIGENVLKLSTALKQEYLNIEWQQIKDFRNRIVHDYVGIDLAIVYEIITNHPHFASPKLRLFLNRGTDFYKVPLLTNTAGAPAARRTASVT
ncbi:MAG: DUF86 domain-containing protein [Treponema sp.]|nr:DUF86 domain-containing protein [Treponema sp.]